jgi:hypothetical protein
LSQDISETTARREDIRVAVTQSERRLVEAEIALAKVQLDHSAGIDKELSATEQEIDDCTQAIVSTQAVTEVLRDSIPDGAGALADVPFLRITRRFDDGRKVMPRPERQRSCLATSSKSITPAAPTSRAFHAAGTKCASAILGALRQQRRRCGAGGSVMVRQRLQRAELTEHVDRSARITVGV